MTCPGFLVSSFIVAMINSPSRPSLHLNVLMLHAVLCGRQTPFDAFRCSSEINTGVHVQLLRLWVIVPTEGHVLSRTLAVKKNLRRLFFCFVFPHRYPPCLLGHVCSVHVDGCQDAVSAAGAETDGQSSNGSRRFPKNPPHHPKINQ